METSTWGGLLSSTSTLTIFVVGGVRNTAIQCNSACYIYGNFDSVIIQVYNYLKYIDMYILYSTDIINNMTTMHK